MNTENMLKVGVAIWVMSFLASLGVLALIIYVGYHFVTKYW